MGGVRKHRSRPNALFFHKSNFIDRRIFRENYCRKLMRTTTTMTMTTELFAIANGFQSFGKCGLIVANHEAIEEEEATVDEFYRFKLLRSAIRLCYFENAQSPVHDWGSYKNN